MKLYTVNDITLEIESRKVIKITPKQYHLKGCLGATRMRIPKDDPMIAFTPEEAYAKFETKQMRKIEELKEHIVYIDESIDKASKALKRELKGK